MTHPVLNKKFTFLTLHIFKGTGGIENMCKIFGKALSDILTVHGGLLKIFSLHDTANNFIDDRFFSKNIYSAFHGNRIKFIFQTLINGIQSDTLIISHIHLLKIGWCVKLINPSVRIILFCHGIEVWNKKSFFQKMILRKVDVFLCVSKHTANQIKLNNYIDKTRIQVISNCLSPFLDSVDRLQAAHLVRKKFSINQHNKIILSVGRISKSDRDKGFVRVIDSLKNIICRYPDVTYLIAGRYESSEMDFLINHAQKMGVENHIIMTGFVTDQDLSMLYSMSDVFVLPSVKEGFGMVFIEAMFYQLPVIGGNLDGSVDALMGGSFGQLINPYDIDEITKSIIHIFEEKTPVVPDNETVMKTFGFETYKEKIKELIVA